VGFWAGCEGHAAGVLLELIFSSQYGEGERPVRGDDHPEDGECINVNDRDALDYDTYKLEFGNCLRLRAAHRESANAMAGPSS
jgi:hypothetical protein